MRVVFMGTPEFAVASLDALVASPHEVACVYTRPDRPAGRGGKPRPSPVKSSAEAHGLPVRQPTSLREPGERAALADLGPDVVCVAAYGLLLPADILPVPHHGCLNVHASLLPRHRGAAPVHRAILDGDATTGVSIMAMEEGLDTGPVAATTEVAVGDHTVDTLTAELAGAGARLLVAVLDAIESDAVVWTIQDESLATYAEKVGREDLALTPDLRVEEALRRVRASSRHAASRATVCGVALAVETAVATNDAVAQGGLLLRKDGPVLGLADGGILLKGVRPEGRGSMSGEAFVCGLAGPGSQGAGLTWGPVA